MENHVYMVAIEHDETTNTTLLKYTIIADWI